MDARTCPSGPADAYFSTLAVDDKPLDDLLDAEDLAFYRSLARPCA